MVINCLSPCGKVVVSDGCDTQGCDLYGFNSRVALPVVCPKQKKKVCG